MKVGDMVVWCGSICLVTEVYESKCWRTEELGIKVNWGAIPREAFARILFKGLLRGVPQVDLEVIDNVE